MDAHSLRRLAKQLESREKFRQDNPLLFMELYQDRPLAEGESQLNKPQTEFLLCTRPDGGIPKRIIMRGSNKQGKTCSVVIRCLCFALGCHPFLSKDHPLYDLSSFIPTPNVGLIVGMNLSQSIEKKIAPEFAKWVPSCVRHSWKKNPQGYPTKLTIHTDLEGKRLESIIWMRCHSDDTEVLTNCGWRLFANLDRSELVMTMNMQTGYLEWQEPISYIRYSYKGPMVQGKTKNLDFLVTPTHNMVVCNYKNRKHDYKKHRSMYTLKPVSYLGRRDATPIQFGWVGVGTAFFDLPWNMNKTTTQLGVLPGKIRIPMGLWMAFLGVYLAEGSTDRGRSVAISQHNTDGRDKIRSLLDSMPSPFQFSENNVSFRIYDTILAKYLKQFGYAKDKFIPGWVKELSPKYLKILFEYMMLGDGGSWVDDRYSITRIRQNYTSCSERLIDDLQEIVLKIGLNGTKFKLPFEQDSGGVIIRRQELFRFNVAISTRRSLVHSKGREFLREVPYDGAVYCLEVLNHTLVTRRNGRVLVSGNSQDQEVMTFEGIDYDYVVYDEPPDSDIYTAVERGLVVSDGFSMIAMTHLSQPWLLDLEDRSVDMGGQDPDIRVIEAGSIYDNVKEKGGFLTLSAVEDFVKIVPKEQFDARVLGKRIKSGSLIYSSFRDEHPYVIPSFDVPSHFTKYEAVDPHDGQDTLWLFGAVMPHEISILGNVVNRVLIIDYLRLHPTLSISEMVKKIKERRLELEYAGCDPRVALLDGKYGSQRRATMDAKEPATWHDKLQEAGVGYVVLSSCKRDEGGLAVGHKLVQEYLRPQFFKIEEEAYPGVVFFDRCCGAGGPVEAMRKYRYKMGSDKPEEDFKGWPDAVRYLLMYQPSYIDLHHGLQRQGSGFRPKDKRAGR